MPRRIKTFGGQKATVPLKNERDMNNIINYFLIQREKAKTEVKRWQADRNWILCLIGFNTAFRAEDLLQLRVMDIEKGYMSIKENKTGKVQNFRLNKLLHEDIMDYVKRNELTSYSYLFPSQKNMNFTITRQQADRILKKAADAIKLKQPFSLHSMRKTFGYHYIKNGGKLLTLMKMYNHDETSTTEIYICWGTDDAEQDRQSIYNGAVHRKGRK
ncbi:tyrosine-type recombinase/integrase [Dielma fastidiosa]|uniref:Phage integrase family protein n=1 Tax=Dielma fastidiosa TaxID=1034346 RepID=A0A318KH63_9FIRM|nr:tyrosine-type recombinase/integrase [Dielma fastidiosa]PXX74664.1 phage integrase family protein [Dielma fastidiosa]